jgi:rhodanese-related sulfurtransferase
MVGERRPTMLQTCGLWRQSAAQRRPGGGALHRRPAARVRAPPVAHCQQVLDARTAPEFAVSHIKEALPIDPYRPSLNTIRAFPRDTPIVVYSSAGYRSARVASWLAKAGYGNVRNLSGSLFQWANEAKPLFREESRPTALVHPYDRKWGRLVEGRYRAEAPEVEGRSAAP